MNRILNVQVKKGRWQRDMEGVWVSFLIPADKAPYAIKTVSELKEREYDLTLKEHRERRSLDANAMFWAACALIAEALREDKEKVYLDLLERYGVFTHIIVKPKAVESFKKEYRLCRELGEVTVNGVSGIQLQCYFGSSTYDTKQMSRLIDGAVSELKEMGIDFLPPADILKAKESWGTDEKKDKGAGDSGGSKEGCCTA